METTMLSTLNNKKFHLKNNASFMEAQLENAIRKGTVKSFMKKGIKSVEFSDLVPNESASLSQHLLQLKGSCSQLNRQIKTKEHDTTKYKDETDFVAERSRKIKSERHNLQNKIKTLQNQLDMISMKKNSALHSYKTYQHILDRMKKDDITYQLRKNQLEKQQQTLEKKFKYLQNKNYSAIQMERLGYHGLKQAQEQHQQQKKNRKAEFENINEVATKKKQNMEKSKERQKKTEQIQELAAGDLQDAEILRLKKFLIVQIFLKSLMKSKISRLKAHYQPYELAFYKIKSHTHVKCSVSLKNQFFNFEDNYNDKVAWVKHIEMEIKECEEQKKCLKKKLNLALDNQLKMFEQFEEQEGGEQNVDRQELNHKSILYDLAEKKIRAWLQGQAKKLKISDRNQNLTVQQCFEKIFLKLKEKKYLKKKTEKKLSSQKNMEFQSREQSEEDISLYVSQI